jgi:hypothetical protein
LSNSLGTVSDGYAIVSGAKESYSPTTNLASVSYVPTGFTVTLLNGRLPSNDVRKIVIETQEDTFGFEQCLATGDCTEN